MEEMKKELEDLIDAAEYVAYNNIDEEQGQADLIAAIVAARKALENTGPHVVLAAELCDGDLVAFDAEKFDTIGTMQEFGHKMSRTLGHVTWEKVARNADGVAMLLGVPLRIDRTYVVKRSSNAE